MLAARRAFDEGPWPRMGFAERGALLHRFADLIEANADALALAVHRRGAADGQRPSRLHPVRAGRRGRRDRAVELPAHARVLEGTGKTIAGAAAANLVPVSLELGGKGANIVFDDADLDNAVAWSIRAIFSNAGQVCLAGSRLYVQRGIYAEFTDRFVAAAKALVAGDPKDEATQLGPLASEQHYRKVRSYLDGIEADGGTIRTGGLGDGWVVLPTVVENAPPAARICREEVFGPVVTIAPFDDDEDAIRSANDTRYGLNAMVFTRDLSRAHRASAALRAGTVWVNCFFVRDLRAPFGGVGDSGIGREGGTFSREFFTEPKAVVMQV